VKESSAQIVSIYIGSSAKTKNGRRKKNGQLCCLKGWRVVREKC
jgi:hypothetical protein